MSGGNFFRSLAFLAFCVLTQAQVGCVAFRGVGLDDVTEDKYGTITSKIAVNFSNQSVIRDEKGRETYFDTKTIVEGYMLSASGFFLTTQSIEGEEDAHLRFKTVARPSDLSLARRIPMGLYLGVSLVSLGVIPYFESIPRRLEVEVVVGGKVVKKYHYDDYVLLISSLAVLPWWRYPAEDEGWYDTHEMMRQVDYNIVKHFLRDFYRDFMPRPKPKKDTKVQKTPAPAPSKS